MKKFGIDHLFSYLEFNVANKAETIRRIVQKENVSPQKCCFISDTPLDILQGNEAGVMTIAFLNDYMPEELIAAANPDVIMEDFEGLPKILKNIVKKKRS